MQKVATDLSENDVIIVQKTDSTTKITVRTIFFPPFIAKYSLCISKLSGYFFCAFLSLSA